MVGYGHCPQDKPLGYYEHWTCYLLRLDEFSVLDFSRHLVLIPIEFHAHMDEISAHAADNLLVQEIGHPPLVIEILSKIRRFVDEELEHLATHSTANIEKEALWRLPRGTSTKQLLGESFKHVFSPFRTPPALSTTRHLLPARNRVPAEPPGRDLIL